MLKNYTEHDQLELDLPLSTEQIAFFAGLTLYQSYKFTDEQKHTAYRRWKTQGAPNE